MEGRVFSHIGDSFIDTIDVETYFIIIIFLIKKGTMILSFYAQLIVTYFLLLKNYL